MDKNNPYVAEAFRDYGDVRVLGTAEFTRETVRDADALVVRSETKVTRELLDGSRVRFVGSATIGTDHVDLDFLKQAGIGFASAPGCNANSVADYVVAALLRHASQHRRGLAGKTLGIVGVGNVGSRVAHRARALAMRVLENDPPRARNERLPHFVSLDEVMEADFVTLHVPLTRQGPDATYHLFDAARIARMKRGSVLLNTARGAVVETAALKEALGSGHLSAALLDVWENEPAIDTDLLKMVELGTSHIAGYSFDGKLNAVRMIHKALGEFYSLKGSWSVPSKLPPPTVEQLTYETAAGLDVEHALREVVRSCYDIGADDEALRTLLALQPGERVAAFRRLRANYGVRREFLATTVRLVPDHGALRRVLEAQGFRVEIS